MGDLNLTTRLQAGKAITADLINNVVSNATVKALPISKIDNLQSVLDGKSDNGHVHEIANVNGLQASLDKIGEIQSNLDNHKHEIAIISGLQETLNSKVNTSVVEELRGSKAHKIHSHEIQQVNGLQERLAAIDGRSSRLESTAKALDDSKADKGKVSEDLEKKVDKSQLGLGANQIPVLDVRGSFPFSKVKPDFDSGWIPLTDKVKHNLGYKLLFIKVFDKKSNGIVKQGLTEPQTYMYLKNEPDYNDQFIFLTANAQNVNSMRLVAWIIGDL